MVETNKEYFFSPYYFFISEKHDKISLYYSIAETLTESRKNDDKLDFDKKDLDKVKKGVSNILKDKKIKTKSNIKKYFDKLNKGKEEIEELEKKTKVIDLPSYFEEPFFETKKLVYVPM